MKKRPLGPATQIVLSILILCLLLGCKTPYTTDRDNPFSVSANRLIRPRYAQAVRGHALNIMLLGDPGTGKSRAASLIAGMYGELGLLPVGHTVSVSATELDTAEELHAAVRRAIGGALVIDEAYALMNQYGGQNVIDALIADMGTYAGQFAVVFAGYKDQTRRLMESNEGLNRRIGREIVLENYTWEQIEQIFFVMAENDDSVDASRLLLPKNRKKTDHIFKGWVQEAGPHWGNAGEAEKLLSEMKRLCGVRLSNSYMPDHNNEKLLLDIEDFPESMQIWASDQEQSLKDAYAKLDEFVGLDNIKKAVYKIARSMQMNQNKEKRWDLFSRSLGLLGEENQSYTQHGRLCSLLNGQSPGSLKYLLETVWSKHWPSQKMRYCS